MSLTRKLPGLDKAQDYEGEDIPQVTSQEKCQFHLTRRTTTQRLSTKPLFSKCVCTEIGERRDDWRGNHIFQFQDASYSNR